MKNYGWDPVKLSDAYSIQDLILLRQRVEQEHANPKGPDGHAIENGRPTIYLYDKAGRKKLDRLAYAITFKMKDSDRS